MRALVISTDAPTVLGPPQGHWSYADWARLPETPLRIGELFAGAPDTSL